MPASTLSNVVLPLPFAPTRPARSWDVIIQLRSSNSSLGPKRLPAPESWIIYTYFLSRPSEAAQRIADNDVHPAENRNREVVAFGEIVAVIVSRQKNIGARRELQVRFINVAGRACGALVNIVGGQGLRRSGEAGLRIAPASADVPTIGRAREGASVGGHVFGHDGAREPVKIKTAMLAVGIIGAPRCVSDHIAFVLQDSGRSIQHHAIARELLRGLEQPGVALGIIAAFQINHKFP